MKKFFALATTATMLFGLASCSSELDAPEVIGDGNVNLTVTLPGDLGTRAFSDGLTAENLQVAVYDVTNPDNVTLATTLDKTFDGALQTTISLNLANGRSYKIALFASLQENSPYTFSAEDRNITVDYTKMTEYNSTDNYDCFYKLYETGKVTGAISETITLYRPVAQINWGTSDLEEDVLRPVYGTENNDDNLTNLYTKVSTKAYTEFSLLDGNVVEGTQTEVNLPLATRPSGEDYPYQPKNDEGNAVKTYEYLSMQYLLVPQASSLVDLTLESAASANASTTIAKVTVSNAPVQANYRTNIFGALLTNPADFTVVKNEGWAGEDYIYPVVPIEVKTDAELAEAIKSGGNYVIPEGQDLTIPDLTESVALSRPLKLQVDGKMSLTTNEDPNKYSNLALLRVSSNVELTGTGTIEANGGDFMISVGNNGNLSIDGVDIVYNCQEKSANRAAINTGVNPVTIKNSSITTNCTAIRQNNSGRLIMENTEINVNLRSDGGNMWEAIFSRGNVSLTNVKINSKARGLEVDASMNKPFDAVVKDCEFYTEADRVLYISSAWTEGSKLTIDGGKYSCKNSTGTEYKAPIIFDSNRNGKKFDCNIISGEFVKLPWGFQTGTWPDWIDDDPSVYLAPGSRWEEITPAATNPVYTWRVVKE